MKFIDKKKFDEQTKQNKIEKKAIDFLRQTINFNFLKFSMCIAFHIVLILLMHNFKLKKNENIERVKHAIEKYLYLIT